MPGPWERYAATATASSGPWANYGAPPPAAPPEPPGFGERLAQSFGIPTSQAEAEAQARDSAAHQLEAGMPGLAVARGYGNQLAQTWKEYKEQLSDIADRFTSKQIDKTEATKQLMNAAAIHGVKAIPIFGQTLFNYGQDIEQKNYPGAAGSALGFTAQVAGPKAVETVTPAVAAGTKGAVRTGVRAANAALQKAPEAVAGGVGALLGQYFDSPTLGALAGSGVGTLARAVKIPTIPGENFGRPIFGPEPAPPGYVPPTGTLADMSKFYGKTPTRSNLKANQRQLASPTASTAPVPKTVAPVPKGPHPPDIMKILTTPGEVSDADMVKLQNYFTGHAATVAETVRHSLAKAGD